MSKDKNRLLLEMERAIKEINREFINPEFEKLVIDNLSPVLKVVARARVEYLKTLFDIVDNCDDDLPSMDQISELQRVRLGYEELVAASRALETAIERGYLDVISVSGS